MGADGFHLGEYASAYRGVEGRSCAIGCLIKDEFYDPGLEGRTVQSRFVRKALEASLGPLGEEDFGFIQNLQVIHDCRDFQYWEEALDQFAKEHGLETNTIGT